MLFLGGGEINGEDDVKCEAPLVTIKSRFVFFSIAQTAQMAIWSSCGRCGCFFGNKSSDVSC